MRAIPCSQCGRGTCSQAGIYWIPLWRRTGTSVAPRGLRLGSGSEFPTGLPVCRGILHGVSIASNAGTPCATVPPVLAVSAAARSVVAAQPRLLTPPPSTVRALCGDSIIQVGLVSPSPVPRSTPLLCNPHSSSSASFTWAPRPGLARLGPACSSAAMRVSGPGTPGSRAIVAPRRPAPPPAHHSPLGGGGAGWKPRAL